MPRKKEDTVTGIKPDGEYFLLFEPNDILSVLKAAREVGLYSFDIETTSLDVLRAEMVGVSICSKERVAFYIKWESIKGVIFDSLKSLLETVPGVYSGGKYDYAVLSRQGISPLIGADIVVMQYVLDPDNTARGVSMGLKDTALRILGIRMTEFEEMTGGGPIELVEEQSLIDYAAADADMTLRLYNNLKEEFSKNPELLSPLAIDTAIIPVVAKMEMRGILIDKPYLENAETLLAPVIESLRMKIMAEAGVPFEIDSGAQLGKILFEHMGLPAGAKTPNGRYKTSEPELSKLAEDYKIVRLVLEYKDLNKMCGTFVKGIMKGVSDLDGCCHTSFLTTVVPTGRFASSTGNVGGGGYNIQQIPKGKIELSDGQTFSMRRSFIPHPGCKILEADYKAIEFRIFLNMCKQEKIIDEILNNVDVHVQTYAEIFGLDPKNVSKDQREQGKTFNYGLLYGMAPFSLAGRIKSTEDQARYIIEKFFERHDRIWEYSRQIEAFAKRNKYIQTFFGRRRTMYDLLSGDRKLYGKGLRGSVNSVIQGTGADIMRIALSRLEASCNPFGEHIRLLLTVHDSVVLEYDASVPDWLAYKTVKEAMEFDIPEWRLPMEVDIKAGTTWADAKELNWEKIRPRKSIRMKHFTPEIAAQLRLIAAEYPGDYLLQIEALDVGKTLSDKSLLVDPNAKFDAVLNEHFSELLA